MIRFEHGMLVLDSSATLEDMVAVADFQEYVRNKEQERILKLLKEVSIDYPPIKDYFNEIKGKSEKLI